MNDIDKFTIFPLFPSAVAGVVIEEDLSELDSIKQHQYQPLTSDESTNSYKTVDNSILRGFPHTQRLIMDRFNRFKSDVLKLDNQFAVSSSWATRTENGGYSQYHDHRNSFYSAVLYLEDAGSGGEIQFQSPLPNTVFLLNPKEWNSFNYEVYHISPARNLLLFFPSYLKHRINRYQGSEPRYSLAVNLVPVGEFGRGDSRVHYQLVE